MLRAALVWITSPTFSTLDALVISYAAISLHEKEFFALVVFVLVGGVISAALQALAKRWAP